MCSIIFRKALVRPGPEFESELQRSLSIEARSWLSDFRESLRNEYRQGCNDHQDISQLASEFRCRLRALEGQNELQYLRTIARSLEGDCYTKLDRTARRQLLIEVGRQIGRLLGDAPEPASARAASKAPGEVQNPSVGGQTGLRLDLPLTYLKGVGPKLAKLMQKFGVFEVKDLVELLPRRFEDRTNIITAARAIEGEMAVIRGKLGRVTAREPRRGLSIVNCPLYSPDGMIDLIWFNQHWILSSLKQGLEVFAFGKVENKNGRLQLNAPELEAVDADFVLAGRLVPVYPATARLSQRWIRSLMLRVVPDVASRLEEPLPSWLRAKRGLMDRGLAVLEYHFPTSPGASVEARRRLAYEELYLQQIELAVQRRSREQEPRQTVYRRELMRAEDFFSLLPFRPTKAQARVAEEILADLVAQVPMNRLLQGDVGSGKTAIAAFAAWAAIRQGYQAAIMAPTEILAEQHYHKLSALLQPAGIRLGFLAGSQRKKAKDQVKAALAAHEINLVVGTHALIQDNVEFARLSLIVVDEQHKFGVLQRTIFRQKGYKNNPDLLVMTATPIPRTLALTVHGELDVSKLDELPPGRTPIRSKSVPFAKRKSVYQEIREELGKGRQAYIICPLIEESESIEATSATAEHRVFAEQIFPDFSVGLLHGRMKATEKEAVMEAFRQGQHHILVSTTVIEVGVDVPNATIMLVQDANRFGLSQLHQLRGRVGRGAYESHCIFMADAKSAEGVRRLKAIAELSDGFEVAEEDLQIRGPGDYFGLRQSGFPEFQVADLTRDGLLLEEARKDSFETLERDPELKIEVALKRKLKLRAEATAELVH